jgi:hypothetical protein
LRNTEPLRRDAEMLGFGEVHESPEMAEFERHGV